MQIFTGRPQVRDYYSQAVQELRTELERSPIAAFRDLSEEEFVALNRERYELPHLTVDAARGGFQFEQPPPIEHTNTESIGTLYVFLRPHPLNAKALQLGADGTWMETTILQKSGRFDDARQVILVPANAEGLPRLHQAIENNLRAINRAIDNFTPWFSTQLAELFRLRHAQIDSARQKEEARSQAAEEITARLGIGLRRIEGAIEPVNVRPAKKVELLRQVLHEARESRERRLTDDEVRQIVAVINQAGQGFETAPEVFNKLTEPDLSTVMAGYLNAVFHADVATRETFVKGGKTDLHIKVGDRQDSVLVVECKLWDGYRAYSDALDQLWSYVTLRHSVGILATFARGAPLSAALKEAPRAIRDHPSYVSGPDTVEETHLVSLHAHPDDKARRLDLHHLFFNLHVGPTLDAVRAGRRRTPIVKKV